MRHDLVSKLIFAIHHSSIIWLSSITNELHVNLTREWRHHQRRWGGGGGEGGKVNENKKRRSWWISCESNVSWAFCLRDTTFWWHRSTPLAETDRTRRRGIRSRRTRRRRKRRRRGNNLNTRSGFYSLLATFITVTCCWEGPPLSLFTSYPHFLSLWRLLELLELLESCCRFYLYPHVSIAIANRRRGGWTGPRKTNQPDLSWPFIFFSLLILFHVDWLWAAAARHRRPHVNDLNWNWPDRTENSPDDLQ